MVPVTIVLLTVEEGITENGGYIENCDFARFRGSNAVRTARCRGDRGGRNQYENPPDFESSWIGK